MTITDITNKKDPDSLQATSALFKAGNEIRGIVDAYGIDITLSAILHYLAFIAIRDNAENEIKQSFEEYIKKIKRYMEEESNDN